MSGLAGRLPQYAAAIGEKIGAVQDRITPNSKALEPARGFLRALDREIKKARSPSTAADAGGGRPQTAHGLITGGASGLLGSRITC